MLYYLFNTLWMIICAPWLGLTTVVVKLASHSLAILIVGLYILCSLPLGKKLIAFLAQKLCVVALFPINWTLSQIWYVLTAQASYFHLIHKRTWQLVTQLKGKPSKDLCSGTQWAYYGFVIFYINNTSASETILDTLVKRLSFIMLLHCLERFWLIIFQGSHTRRLFQLMKDAKEWWYPRPAIVQPEICTLDLPSRNICINEPLLELIPSTQELSPKTIYFHFLTKPIEKDDNNYHFKNIEVPLNTRTRSDRMARRLTFRE